MRKNELVKLLVDKYFQDYDEMVSSTKEELEELLEELEDSSDMYPNGRDFDAEDEGGLV